MTNYEYLVKYKEKLVKYILAQHVSKEKGIPNRCSRTGCDNCDFGGYPCTLSGCTDATKEWLEAEHEPLYKKGDLVIDSNDQLAVVVHEGDGIIKISHYVDNTIGIEADETSIKKKVGHIDK